MGDHISHETHSLLPRCSPLTRGFKTEKILCLSKFYPAICSSDSETDSEEEPASAGSESTHAYPPPLDNQELHKEMVKEPSPRVSTLTPSKVRIANQTWDKHYKHEAIVVCTRSGLRVHFPESCGDMVTVYCVERFDRKGHWAADAYRFKERVKRVERVVKPFLLPRHRENVYQRMCTYAAVN
jgi:hypothetical protein